MAHPEKLGKYKVLKVLGKGAMGIVYEGTDPVIGRRVAIKTIHKALLEGEGGQELLARFQREAQAAGRLMHPNIVGIYEYGEDLGIPFIAMEFVEGRELKDHIKDKTRFSVEQIVEIMVQVLSALSYCHESGVIHRDLKPANIILLADNKAKIADFGIARVESSTMTQLGAVMGTPSYMSPEQFMGQRVDARADLFSMGCILYELLTGEKPFPGQAVATIMHKVLNAQVENPTDYNVTIPPAFNQLIKKALSKRPNDRFQTAKEFMEAVQQAAVGNYGDAGHTADATMVGQPDFDPGATVAMGGAGAPKPAPPPPRRPPPPQASPEATITVPADAGEKKSLPMGLIIGIAAVVLLGGGGAFWFMNKDTPQAAVQPDKTTAPAKVDAVNPSTAPGVVNAISSPPGAQILVDGDFGGTTPTVLKLPPGDYQIVYRKAGYFDFNASVEIKSGDTIDIEAPLVSME